ncbi:MAG: ATP-binding protein [Candidatus Zixiibacteriota bacterium]
MRSWGIEVRLRGFYLNRSIRTKLAVVMIAGLGMVAMFITIFFPARQKHLAFQELKMKTTSLARMLAFNVSAGLEFEDREAVEEAISGVQVDEDVICVHVIDVEGNEFHSYQREGKHGCPHDFTWRGGTAGGAIEPLRDGGGEDEACFDVPGCSFVCHFDSRSGLDGVRELAEVLLVATPVYSSQNRIGTLILEVSTSAVLAHVGDDRRLTIMVSLVLFLMGMALSGFLASHLTKPLEQLAETTRRVSSGDLSYRIKVETKDEIGHLASSFNKMVSSLREAQQKNQLYLQKIEKSNLILQEQRKEIEAYSHTLEKRVEERTTKLNQAYQELSRKNTELEKALEALKSSQEQVREAERLAVIGEMAGRVAHEVLNPITALLSRTQTEVDYLNPAEKAREVMGEIVAEWQHNLKAGKLSRYLLRKSEEKIDSTYGEEDLAILSQALDENSASLDRTREFLSFFEHHIMRVVKIIDNLREMAKTRKELEQVEVNSCLKEVAELFEDGLKKRNIKLTHKLSPDRPKIYVDYTELFQVFSNLLRNAMQAIESTGRGEGEVTLAVEMAEGEIRVRVIDNGVGIPEENRPLIFDPDFSTKSRKEGTGLGLAISRRLVREMGGELLLESSISEGGSTFLVRLPLTKAAKIAEIDTEKATAV